jgi:hypothetical protein
MRAGQIIRRLRDFVSRGESERRTAEKAIRHSYSPGSMRLHRAFARRG